MEERSGFDMFVTEHYLKAKHYFPREHHSELMRRLRDVYGPVLWHGEKEENMAYYRGLAARANGTEVSLIPVLNTHGFLQLLLADPSDTYTEVEVIEEDVPEYFFNPLEEEEKKRQPRKAGTSVEEQEEDLKPKIELISLETQPEMQ